MEPCGGSAPGSNPGGGTKVFVQSPFSKDYYNPQFITFYVSITFQITLHPSRFYSGTELYVSNKLFLFTKHSFSKYWKNLFETSSLSGNLHHYIFTFQITGVLCKKLKISGPERCHLKRKNQENRDCGYFLPVVSELPLLFLFLRR